MFGASDATHDVPALWVDGFVVASEVELHLFSHSVSVEEAGIRFFFFFQMKLCGGARRSLNVRTRAVEM